MPREGKKGLKWSFYGSSLVSAYWNGAATYYRGILRALAERGHDITFFEPDAYDRQKNRDLADPDWARVHVYPNTVAGLQRALDAGRGADVIVKASGVGVFDTELEAAVADMKRAGNLVLFWDVDAPATLDRLEKHASDPFWDLVPRYDAVFTYGGGDAVVQKYRRFGARDCIPIYNALDRTTHFRVPPEARFRGWLGFLGNRLPDRERRVEDFFLRAAARMPEGRFLLGGSGWGDKPMPANVNYLGHVYTHEHNAFNSSCRAVLNINRDSMASYGFSPPTRVFEAAGAAACLITDEWAGIETFLEPGSEVLVARDGDEVAAHLAALDEDRARRIGEAACRRIRAEHTYEHRAAQIDRILGVGPLRAPHRAAAGELGATA
jgi:spore maturation protein CgeB